MSYVIMRSKKLKMGGTARSLDHAFREQDTPNADPKMTPHNKHTIAKSTDEAMGMMRDRLPEKFRSNAITAVEYLITMSPEWSATASTKQHNEFFQKSVGWLAEKYGSENIFVASVHRDETTPHLTAFVVPRTKDGRLSAKEMIGNRQQMQQDQTDLAAKVAHLGLKRGIEGSKAKHTTIQKYYSHIQTPVEELRLPAINPDALKRQGTFREKEKPIDVANRVTQEFQDEANRRLQPLFVRVNDRERAVEESERAKKTAEKLKSKAKVFDTITRGLNTDQSLSFLKKVVEAADVLRDKIKQTREQEREAERQTREIKRGQDKGIDI